jgi:hypothetical protein
VPKQLPSGPHNGHMLPCPAPVKPYIHDIGIQCGQWLAVLRLCSSPGFDPTILEKAKKKSWDWLNHKKERNVTR